MNEPLPASTPLTQTLGRLGRKSGRLRFFVQSAFAFFCLFAGYRFTLFYLWATGASDRYVPQPPAVEGFLPIGALVGLKRLVLTGGWDMIHPAGLTIFLAALAIGLFLRKGFCGWICPVGFASNLAERAGRRLKILWRPPAWVDLPLLSVKYLLLAFFAYLILWLMPLAAIESFQRSPYNMVAAGKMLLFFLQPTVLAGSITLGIVFLSFVLRNFWCRYLCPYGALLGLLALAGPLHMRRDPEKCIDCKKCEKICPGSIRITRKRTVRSAECVGCTECAAVCPVEDCLTLSAPAGKKIPHLLLPAAVLGLFFLFYLVALLSGHWHSEVEPASLRRLYQVIMALPHPGL